MTVISGTALAAAMNDTTAAAVQALRARGITPCLAVVLVGDDEPSRIYVKRKEAAAAKLGIEARVHHLPANASTSDILAILKAIQTDAVIHGVIVQMPLPPQVDTQAVLAALPPAKDVDGLSPASLGALFAGNPTFVPCTPQGCMALIASVRPSLAGLNAVVIGRSRLVGKPMAHLLLAADCTVTIAHSKSANLPDICRAADILVVAAGRAGLVQGDWIKPGATVIDVGITRRNDTLVGDVDFAAASKNAAHITPVPGGVGPMTVACLLRNTVYACRQQQGGAHHISGNAS